MAELSASLLHVISQDGDAGRPQQTARSSTQGVVHRAVSAPMFTSQQIDLLSQLRSRISAIEAWAHALDSSQAVGDGESAAAIEALVKQAVLEVTSPPSLGAAVVRLEQLESQVQTLVASAAVTAEVDESDMSTPSLHSRITILEKKTEECLSACAKLLCEKDGTHDHLDASHPDVNPYHAENADVDLPG
eukprot:5751700-Amphidinium_carterae.1